MNTDNGTLRISIDRSWTAAEMAESIQEINFLYDVRLYLNALEDLESYRMELYDFFPPYRYWARRHGYSPMHFPDNYPILFRPEDVRQYSRIYFPQFALRISRLEYSSPGAKDFLGLGEILKQIRLFLQFRIERRDRAEERKLSNDAQRIQNARDFIKLRLEAARAEKELDGRDNDGLAEFLEDHTRSLQRLIDNGKITSAVMLEIERKDEESKDVES